VLLVLVQQVWPVLLVQQVMEVLQDQLALPETRVQPVLVLQVLVVPQAPRVFKEHLDHLQVPQDQLVFKVHQDLQDQPVLLAPMVHLALQEHKVLLVQLV
jgi:hypothetical protein